MNKILKNDYFLSLCSKVLVMFFGFISLIFLNRFLGPDLKGEYSSILNYVMIISAVLQFGTPAIYPRFKRKKIYNCYEVFISLAFLQFLVYALCAIVLLIIFNFNMSVVAVCAISVVAVLAAQLRYINMVENMARNTVFVFIMSLCNCILTFLAFLFLDKDLVAAFVIYIVKDLTMVLLYVIKTDFKKLFKKQYIEYYWPILKEGILPMLSGLLIMLNYKLDIIMLDAYSVDFSAIGIYSLGLSIAEYAWVIPDIFKDVVQKRTAKDNSIGTVNFSLRCSSSFVIAAFIIIAILNKWLFVILFGEDFADAYYITMILFFGVYSIVFYKIIGQLFISDGKARQYFTILLFGVIANVVINSAIIPVWGIYGAAIASVVSYALVGVVFLMLYLKYYNVRPSEILLIKKRDIIKMKKMVMRKSHLESYDKTFEETP